MKQVQEEIETFRNFSKRTEELAVRLGMDLSGVAALLGISRPSFFSYRTGKRPISGKAWAKLEAAERAAGIGGEPPTVAADREPAPPSAAEAPDPERLARMEEDLTRIEADLARMGADLTTQRHLLQAIALALDIDILQGTHPTPNTPAASPPP